jgi:hypothetical protein
MRWGLALIGVALLVGTVTDRPWPRRPGLLAVDFHVHAFPLSWSPLAPWDIVREAKHQGLDAIAIAGHNHVWAGRAGSLTVISAEEVHPPRGHIIALGIQRTVDWDQSSETIIDEIHRQGGVAIAAHPTKSSWDRWPDAAVRKLDGSEVKQPITILNADAGREMSEFHERVGGAAIGSSDYHGLGPIGLTRTCVDAAENTEVAILEAVRAGRTSIGDCGGHEPPHSILGSACGLVGLLVMVLWRRPSGLPCPDSSGHSSASRQQ